MACASRTKMKIFTILFTIFVFLVWGWAEGVAEASESRAWTSPRLAVAWRQSESREEVMEEVSLREIALREVDRQWQGVNTVRKLMAMAVANGVEPETVVLLVLLPLTATGVSLWHYLVGLSGYGIFMPTMVAITFLVTGISEGVILLVIILLISVLGGSAIKKMKLHFWPARALGLLLISLAVLILMAFSSSLWFDIGQISIFPVLMMIMLSEEFVRTQLVKSKAEAVKLTVGTLVLAIFGGVIMRLWWVREATLLYPELMIVLMTAINWWIGNYRGMRLVEIGRFGKAIRSERKRLKISN